MKKLVNFIWLNLEMFIWIAALILLYHAGSTETHFTICPIKNLGFNFCPGCGLGHSIGYALHFKFSESLSAHPLGIIAIFIILKRIINLFYNNIINNLNYGNKSVTTHSWR